MYYVYILSSLKNPQKNYVGYSMNLKKRLIYHNNGWVKSTTLFKPWKIVWQAGFEEKQKAMAFEKYLKSGSGSAFRNKRLV